MKKRRFKTGFTLLVTIFILSATGCGAVQEKISEGIVEGVTGAKVDIQEGGNKLVLEDGELETGDDLEWPKGDMGDLPIPKAKIVFIMKDNNNSGCTVSLTEFELKDAKAYLEKLIAIGYIDGANMQDAEFFMYSGKREDGTEISFMYNNEPKDGVLTYAKTQ